MGAELTALPEIQDRIDVVAADVKAGRRRFAFIDTWQLGELRGLDFHDTADWCRVSLARGNGSSSEFLVARTCLKARNGDELNFELCIGDAGEPFDARSP